jgi:hypothetical protein
MGNLSDFAAQDGEFATAALLSEKPSRALPRRKPASQGVATISTGGLAHAISAGTSTISATLGSASGSTLLTVSPKVLISIAVTPANASIPAGTNQQFTATGTYSDASIADLTASVTWASSSPGVATISAGGLAHGLSPGTSTISATLAGKTGSTVLTIGAKVLVSIEVTPRNPSIAVGANKQFTATGHYLDGSSAVLTSVIWTSARPRVATITAGGRAHGVSKGTSTISATLGAVRGSTLLAVKSLIPPHSCTVPNVVGKHLGVAKSLIKRAHCRTGKVGYAYSRKRTRGYVISQSRRPGQVLSANTKINLVVSRGRKG